MNWTLGQLRALSALGEYGTMTAAASNLGYTAGAISQQLSTLQAAVPEKLFVKEGRRIAFTDAGLNLLVHAKAILDAEDKAAEAFGNIEGNASSPVKLGVFGSAALFALPRTLQILSEKAEGVTFQAYEVDVIDMPRAVLEGRLDVALGVDYSGAPQPPHRGLISTRLLTEEFKVVLPAGRVDPGCTRRELLAFANDADWILPPADTAFGKAALFACARAGIQPKERHTVVDTALSIALAESGVGITIATPLMLALRPTKAPVVDILREAQRHIVALTQVERSHRLSVRRLNQALKASFESLR